MKNLKTQLFLILTAGIITSCSSGEKLGREDNKIAVFEDGLYLSESGEDGVVELVIPEVEEYTEVKNEAQEKANLGSLELGTSEEDEETAESVERSIASIGEEVEEELYEEPEAISYEEPQDVVASQETPADSGERFEEYVVQKNDSLMLISFKLYSKFDNWKSLADWNGIREDSDYQITEGDSLRFKVSDDDGTPWIPSGNQYLVKTGDYLGLISQKVYEGNARFWYDIWKNNDALIKDPNRVFVGFTLYTQPFEVVLENEKVRMEEYRRRFGGKRIRKRDLAGALDDKLRL